MRALVLALVLVGCSGKDDYKPLPPSSRQSPPEPLYVTVMEGRPPLPVPQTERERLGMADKLILKLSSTNKYLDDVAKDLENQSGYRIFVAPSISKRRVSLDSSGTIDDLATEVARNARCKVSVDHIAKEIRFVAGTTPRL
jgi:hypothetical protein